MIALQGVTIIDAETGQRRQRGFSLDVDLPKLIEVLEVNRTKAEVRHRQSVMKPTRMETPLTFARDTLYLRTTGECIALRVE